MPTPGPWGPIPDRSVTDDVMPHQERIEYIIDHRVPDIIQQPIPGPVTLESSDSGGYDTSDSTSRLTVQSYQTNGLNFFGEGIRLDLMRPIAKNMIAWRLPRDEGFDDPETLRSVTWIGAHYYAQDQADLNNPTDVHGHWSIEVPDENDLLRTRLEIGFVNRATGTIGVAKTNIKTNLADFTVNANAGTGGSGVLRIAGPPSNNRDIEFGNDIDGSQTAVRWRLRTDNTESGTTGADFRFIARDSALGAEVTRMRLERSTGHVTIGKGGTAAGARLDVEGSGSVHGFRVKTTSDLGSYAAAYIETFDTNDRALDIRVTGDTVSRILVQSDGRLEFGPGNNTRDTVLYRAGTNLLRTEDDFEVAGSSFGLILTSPNGTRYRVRVSDAGALTLAAA